MEPTIGRIVIFHLSDEEAKNLNNHQQEAPAIITAVWNKDCVNLKVILDGKDNLWITSAVKGSNENEWHWPKIK